MKQMAGLQIKFLMDPVWAVWPMGGAWICTDLWEHYTYTLDKVSSGFLIKYQSLNIIESKSIL